MTPAEKGTRDGSRQVIECLEKWLAKARNGEIDHVALCVTYGVAAADMDFAGVFGREPIVNFTLDMMRMRVQSDFIQRMNPPSNAGVSADKWAYNLARSPCSYDFVTWLVNAEMTRMREGAPAPLKVAFYTGDIPMESVLHTPERTQMFLNVMRPALALLGAVESPEAQNGRIAECFSYLSVVQEARQGKQVPKFRAPFPSEEPGAVTITLRESKDNPHRNSDPVAWWAFAQWLRERGENVIVIKDAWIKPISLQDRMSLYDGAKCNLFVANGPATLAWFSDAPWLMFGKPDPNDHYFPNTPDGWKNFTGLDVGEQFPWARPDQRIVWESDRLDVLKQAWLAFEKTVQAKAA